MANEAVPDLPGGDRPQIVHYTIGHWKRSEVEAGARH